MPSDKRDVLARPSVRTDIVKSWKRSQMSGVDPTRLDIVRTEADAESSFIAAGAPVLRSMTDLLAGTSTSLSLADPSGAVTWRWESDSTITSMLDRSEFELGSQFAEPCAGTNGIGLAISERRPTHVVGSEHYKQVWHMWACFAAPVSNPMTGQLSGLVNIACRAEDANHFLAVALRSLVDGIRTAMRDEAAPRQHRLLETCLRLRAATAQPVVALDRTMMLVDDKAAALHLDRAQLWSAIVDAGPNARRIHLHGDVTADMYPVARRSLSDGVILVFGSLMAAGVWSDFQSIKSTEPPTPSVRTRLQQAEEDIIRAILLECRGNKSEAAEQLGISRGTLYQRLRRYRIDG